MNIKYKIIVFGPFPPPMHGVSYLLNEFIGFCNKKRIITKVIKTSPDRNEHSFNNINATTLILMIKLICSAFYAGLFERQSVIYFNVATKGVALYRDIIIAIIFRLLKTVPYIHIHGTELSNQSSNIKKIIKFAFKGSHIIYVSKPLEVEHIWLNEVVRTINVVPNGCEDLLDQQSRMNFSTENNILFFSNFYKQKGVKEFLATLTELEANGYLFSAVMCGSFTSDYTEKYLTECISKLKLHSKLTVLGPTYGSSKRQVFNAADFLIFPSHKESFGNVMIEAMSSNTLVIASETTSTSYILDSGRCGYYKAQFNVKNIAKIISELDEVQHKLWITNARQRYEELFNINRFNQNLIETLVGKC